MFCIRGVEIPLLIGSRVTKDGVISYTNVRAYDNTGYLLFRLLGMPYELHPDIPATEDALYVWHEAMKHLIKSGTVGTYLKKFFGDYVCGTDVWTFTEGTQTVKSITRESDLFQFHDYVINGKTRIMTANSLGLHDQDAYYYYINSDGIGYRSIR